MSACSHPVARDLLSLSRTVLKPQPHVPSGRSGLFAQVVGRRAFPTPALSFPPLLLSLPWWASPTWLLRAPCLEIPWLFPEASRQQGAITPSSECSGCFGLPLTCPFHALPCIIVEGSLSRTTHLWAMERGCKSWLCLFQRLCCEQISLAPSYRFLDLAIFPLPLQPPSPPTHFASVYNGFLLSLPRMGSSVPLHKEVIF